MKSQAKRLLEEISNFERKSHFRESIQLNELANLREKDTGLPVIIYASPRQHSTGPRIKVARKAHDFNNDEDNFSVFISENPVVIAGDPKGIVSKEILEKIFNWVKRNLDILLDYWDGVIKTEEFYSRLEERRKENGEISERYNS